MMKKVLLFCLALLIFTFSGCDFLQNFAGNKTPEVDKIDSELTSATGQWTLLGDEDTFFVFDGSKNVMTYRYVEDSVAKYEGSFRVVYRGTGKEVITPLTFIFTRKDKAKEDWIGCYVDNFNDSFTQFTVFSEEEDLGMIDGTIYTHIYRISELPYKMGSYVLEGREHKEDANDYKYANELFIPTGTYALPTGESFTFLTVKPSARELFQYRNGEVIVEGTYTVAADKKTIYLYIEHDPYSKITNADKKNYDTTFSMYYPPDFYLRGDFSSGDGFVINDLYHHTYSPTQIQDEVWGFGSYTKQ